MNLDTATASARDMVEFAGFVYGSAFIAVFFWIFLILLILVIIRLAIDIIKNLKK